MKNFLAWNEICELARQAHKSCFIGGGGDDDQERKKERIKERRKEKYERRCDIPTFFSLNCHALLSMSGNSIRAHADKTMKIKGNYDVHVLAVKPTSGG